MDKIHLPDRAGAVQPREQGGSVVGKSDAVGLAAHKNGFLNNSRGRINRDDAVAQVGAGAARGRGIDHAVLGVPDQVVGRERKIRIEGLRGRRGPSGLGRGNLNVGLHKPGKQRGGNHCA